MKKNLAFGILAAGMSLQLTTAALANPPLPPPIPPPSQHAQDGTLEIQKVTRRSGGEWYRISLRRPVSLERIEITVLSMKIKIHEGSVITESRERLAVRDFSNVPVSAAGTRIVSENLNLNDRIIAIDIRAESYGGYADIQVAATSNEGRPQLVLGDLPVDRPSRPTRPDRPHRPDRPSRPDNSYGDCYRRSDVADQLRSLDADLVLWVNRMNNATYGSTEYNMANTELQRLGAYMVSIASSREAASSSIESLESIGAEFFRKMNQATYGTTQYVTYERVGKATFGAMGNAIDSTLACDLRDTNALLRLADSYVTKMNNSTYGTTPYNGYSDVASKLYLKAPAFYEQEVLSYRKSFQQIDPEMESFHKKMDSYTYGSIGYNAYVKITEKAAALAENDLRQRASYISPSERFEFVRYFDGRRDHFTYGSAPYNHYERMKSIAANGR